MVAIIHPDKSARRNDPVVQKEVGQARPSDQALSLLNESRFLQPTTFSDLLARLHGPRDVKKSGTGAK